MTHPANKVKPREERVPVYKRAGYLYQSVTAYISRMRELVEPSDTKMIGLLDDFERSATEIASGREPRKARE